MRLQITASCLRACLATLLAVAGASAASAQSEGGLYIAGAGFSFQVAAERAMAQNPGGRRFFLLTLPPEAAALAASASPAQRRLRERVLTSMDVKMMRPRALPSGNIDVARPAGGVVPVRGWPAPGGTELPTDQRYFPNEDRSTLPAANEALRQLRSACS